MLVCVSFHEDNTRHHKLVVTGAGPVPIEISEGGVVISREIWQLHTKKQITPLSNRS